MEWVWSSSILIIVSNLVLAIIVGCIIYLLGGALQTGAMNLNLLWAGRWLAGLGVGFLVMIVPIYQYVSNRFRLHIAVLLPYNWVLKM